MGIGNSISLNKNPKTMEQNVNDVSRISQGASIRGTLTSATDIRVDGQVAGTLLSEGKVVTGESALLSGKLICVNADFRGRMEGDIYVKELLSLKSPAEVTGIIYVSKIQVELGVRINGAIKMISEEEFDRLAGVVAQEEEA
ncbi:MAG: polymer-forming cytoskeletal protein [Bacteroidales bacterium]|nr:polymer-forming cytoskeletal protein [Bacteroidales bacterium]